MRNGRHELVTQAIGDLGFLPRLTLLNEQLLPLATYLEKLGVQNLQLFRPECDLLF